MSHLGRILSGHRSRSSSQLRRGAFVIISTAQSGSSASFRKSDRWTIRLADLCSFGEATYASLLIRNATVR